METRYDINDIILLPVKVSTIEINRNGTKYKLKLPDGEVSQTIGENFITMTYDDLMLPKGVLGGETIKEE